MKRHSSIYSLFFIAATALPAFGQAGDRYTNFIRQVQLPTNVIYDLSVEPTGEHLSPLPIDPGGARFELWTVKADPLTVYLLDTKYIGTYVPKASITIWTEDMNNYSAVPRTRADRPFIVDVTTEGLVTDESAQEAAKSVKLLRHVQSYGEDGDGTNLDSSQATLLHQRTLTNNAVHRLSYATNAIPGTPRLKVRGEERFSVFSLKDGQADESQLASMKVQIWPMADAAITGISPNEVVRFAIPPVTVTLHDLYPKSTTYGQIYQGGVQDGVQGISVPGSGPPPLDGEAPEDYEGVVDLNSAVTEDGEWTYEILTVTPFRTEPERLAYVTFPVDRTLNVNATLTTVE